MDMFFAAVEEYDNPSLKEKIFAVGSTGMLCTSNYKARKYGIRAGMPGFVGEALAKRLAKDKLVLVPNLMPLVMLTYPLNSSLTYKRVQNLT